MKYFMSLANLLAGAWLIHLDDYALATINLGIFLLLIQNEH